MKAKFTLRLALIFALLPLSALADPGAPPTNSDELATPLNLTITPGELDLQNSHLKATAGVSTGADGRTGYDLNLEASKKYVTGTPAEDSIQGAFMFEPGLKLHLDGEGPDAQQAHVK